MIRAILATALLWLSLVTVALAHHEDRVAELTGHMRIAELIEIMGAEGRLHADTMAQNLAVSPGNADWVARIDAIYDTPRLAEGFTAAMTDALAEADVDRLIQFYGSARGQRIVDLELSARRAFLDEDIEVASLEMAEAALATGDARALQVARFVEANNLVESNVRSALESSYAFYKAFHRGGGLGDSASENDVLSLVFSREPEIRENTVDWLYSYFYLAQGPLSEEDVEAYIALSTSPAGQALNAALFAAFDPMFAGISGELGALSALMMSAEDI